MQNYFLKSYFRKLLEYLQRYEGLYSSFFYILESDRKNDDGFMGKTQKLKWLKDLNNQISCHINIMK